MDGQASMANFQGYQRAPLEEHLSQRARHGTAFELTASGTQAHGQESTSQRAPHSKSTKADRPNEQTSINGYQSGIQEALRLPLEGALRCLLALLVGGSLLWLLALEGLQLCCNLGPRFGLQSLKSTTLV